MKQRTVSKDRHAYLIMCHSNFNILMKLLKSIDDVRNDIYIHIDKKVNSCPYDILKDSVHNAKINFIKRISVNWGGYSQIRAEMALLDEATKSNHSYYHLISGVDYPLKSQDYIHNYFQDHLGCEFIRFDITACREKTFLDRIRYYYFFQEFIGRNSGKIPALCYTLQEKLLILQKKLHVDRVKRFPEEIYKGTQGFSITHDMALYLLKQKKKIKHLCRYGMCVDEIFLQTMAMQSPYRERIVNNSLRDIDWQRGKPYTFGDIDFEELKSTDRLFARKFDEQVSMEIIEKLHEYIMST